ncbi:hypothetical protein PSN45_004089 [Yamadazyma tenuis]|uniref:NAD(P)-binding domain-containing protein n=1 Tax=Candida tenuis (strain ATCC 10573 / BCRC 21748 / CBS 615 / JCM 9827 / NBRC 10315 / NRRL Y-1498 / VKM Y-70) TaxID=590646 RepID=G3B4I5_CANTC|nr:uncharacterized protein CANTEDRAFT_130224 [Yamadazyma tenuis ATCC 10573]EGV63838.1 hypothetical protein CANTEDRAFT_130224 [Yamadazyma tenuis ATCC 10573]WEJ96550.1 hypothetical protein PSN45_004089 [Yamadazyma tenuis]
MSIAVFGGNGFLGRKICEYGIRNGFKVTSFSRSGIPPLKSNQHLQQVKWESADIFDDSTYKSQLSEFKTVFHSMGKIFEDESYKKDISSGGLNLNFVKKLIVGSNPMDKTIHNSYNGLNKESALKLAFAYYKANKNGKLVYISADKGLPVIVPSDYIRSKREAETELLKSKLNSLIIRPGIMYDEDERNNRYILVNGMKQLHQLKQQALGNDLSCVNNTIRPILSTDQVCSRIFQNLHEDNTVITLEKLMKSY